MLKNYKLLLKANKLKKKFVIFSTLTVLIISTAGFTITSDSDFKFIKSLDIYFSLFKEVNTYYVDNIDPEKLLQSSVDGMLESLDPYTVFIPESEADDYKFMTTGEYGGIGAIIRKDSDYCEISETYENCPALKAGIKAGDKLIEIDGNSLKNKSIDQISELLKGTPNTDIELTIKHFHSEKSEKMHLKREYIKIDNVPYYGMLNEKTGYIKLIGFTTDAAKEVKNAFSYLKDKYQIKSLVLDLRGNPGGLLQEAVDIANLFINKDQEIVSTKGKFKEWNNKYNTRFQAYDTQIPLVLLVNHGSASASEIVAGSLQDLDRAIIIGERTYGKGLVQTTRQLSYNTQLKITTAKYYIPSGRCIQALDYSHRNPDGSVGHVPDSLISEFKTKNGRKVYDGGGILPDIKFPPEQLSQLSFNLLSKNLIFDYVTNYTYKHPLKPVESSFSITEEDFNDFVNYLKENKFNYRTKSEDKLAELKNISKQEKYYSKLESDITDLEQKLNQDKLKDVYLFKDEIKELIEEEIISRFYLQKGRIEYSLKSDSMVIKACNELKNGLNYQTILNYKEPRPI